MVKPQNNLTTYFPVLSFIQIFFKLQFFSSDSVPHHAVKNFSFPHVLMSPLSANVIGYPLKHAGWEHKTRPPTSSYLLCLKQMLNANQLKEIPVCQFVCAVSLNSLIGAHYYITGTPAIGPFVTKSVRTTIMLEVALFILVILRSASPPSTTTGLSISSPQPKHTFQELS